MYRKQLAILFSLFAFLLLMACANIGSPDGGPYDETPPFVTGTSPKFGSTNTKRAKIVLDFNENIKLDNPTEKVVVSPPQLEMPEISASGKRITVELMDSLKPDQTYTIDFADAIEDNNEGNPMGDYAFTFSTGERLDTFQVSGHVLNAENLEPIKGMLVGLYAITDTTAENLPDSVFRTRPLERISRSDSRGHFIIKGLNPKNRYRVFALQDQDGNYQFSQKSEMLAFNHQIIQSTARPDIRLDTIWHDSIHYDSIVERPYTHFYPDNIVLLAFLEGGQNRSFLKSERAQLNKFTLYFTAPDSVLPDIQGLNFDAAQAFVIEKNKDNDTITYWIRDSLIYNNDTLQFTMSYNYTDTLGQLVPRTDPLKLVSRQTYAKVQKQKAQEWEEYAKDYIKEYKQQQKALKYQEDEQAEAEGESAKERRKADKKKSKSLKDEDIEVPPMPEKFLDVRSKKNTLAPDENFGFTFETPIDTVYTSLFHFVEIVDSQQVERPFIIRRNAEKIREYTFYAEWLPGSKYELSTDTGAFVNIYGMRSPGFKRTITVKPLEEYSTLFVTLQNTPSCAIVQLLDQGGKVVKERHAPEGRADFYFVTPGTYYLKVFYDRNGDGVWTTGDYDKQIQGEETYFYPGAFNLRADWEVSQNWNPTATPLPQQKPGKITKQKPDKEKSVKNRNAEREKNKNKGRRNGGSATYGGGTVSAGTNNY